MEVRKRRLFFAAVSCFPFFHAFLKKININVMQRSQIPFALSAPFCGECRGHPILRSPRRTAKYAGPGFKHLAMTLAKMYRIIESLTR